MEPYLADLNDKAEFNGYGFGDDSYAPCTYIESYNYGSNKVTSIDDFYPNLTSASSIETEALAITAYTTRPSPLFGTDYYIKDGYAGLGYHAMLNSDKLTYGADLYNILPHKTVLNTYFKLLLTPKELYIDDVLIREHTPATKPFQPKLKIFQCTTATYFFCGRMHHFKIWDGEKLTHRLVPLYHKKTKMFGLYDTETKGWHLSFDSSKRKFLGGIEPEYTI